ncbi:unnamed protein product [Clonostachys rosea]|uniref:DUF676 domain-containing protein n=1 Tax=Bionectria ochroleuca TaxID=29856 RepID=A0ABY6U9X0_BIOOC|nr:unnamed protein product [Clonostachys rosea]
MKGMLMELLCGSIIFVHGLNGDPIKTWKSSESEFLWPEELGHDLGEVNVWVFGYDTRVQPSFETNLIRIRALGLELAQKLYEARLNKVPSPDLFISAADSKLESSSSCRMECSRRNDLNDILNSTICVMLYGTPNLGSFVDEQLRVQVVKLLGKAVGMKVPPKIGDALKAHSDSLYDLDDDFRRLNIWERPTKPTVTTFYETKTMGKLGKVVSVLRTASRHLPQASSG